MALGQAGRFAMVLTIPGVLAFVLGIIAENKKVSVKNISCCEPSVVISMSFIYLTLLHPIRHILFRLEEGISSPRGTDLHIAEHVESIIVSSCIICLWESYFLLCWHLLLMTLNRGILQPTGDLATQVVKNGIITCLYPKDFTPALGILASVFLFISAVISLVSLIYPYEGKSISLKTLAKSKGLVTFVVLSV